jgi:ribose/xylose/arabinose/galactoside ABC-type transport system permease subunit
VKTRDLLTRGGPLLGLLLVCAVFAFLIGPQFFRPVNLELIARQTAIVCTAALGMTMVIVAAGIDLSVGSIIALSTVVIALLLKRDVSPLFAALGGILGAAVCGLANGVLITRLKVVPFIVTLGTMLIVRGAAKGLADERRGAASSCPPGSGSWPCSPSWSRACCATPCSGGTSLRSDRTSVRPACAACAWSG